MFLGFVLLTLAITYWSARRSQGAAQYFAAGRRITAWQNGLAVAGDYMSAASFLGIAGMIAFNGYDGFMYSVGWLVAYLTVLLIVAEPLRNAGKYTMADLLAYRLSPRPVRAMASLSTLTVSTFYMIAQMVGAGALVKLLAAGRELRSRGHWSRRAHDRLRRFRRHAGDNVGPDHQGRAAHERLDFPLRPRDEAFRLQLWRVLRCHQSRQLDRQRTEQPSREIFSSRDCCSSRPGGKSISSPSVSLSSLERPACLIFWCAFTPCRMRRRRGIPSSGRWSSSGCSTS